MDNKQVTAEWIAQQRQISEIVNMTYEDAPGSVIPLLKQLEKSQTAALDALEAAYAEIGRLTAERDAAVRDWQQAAEGSGGKALQRVDVAPGPDSIRPSATGVAGKR